LGRLLVLHGHQQDSTEMPEEIGASDAEFLLREIPRQLREWRREHQRRDAALGEATPAERDDCIAEKAQRTRLDVLFWCVDAWRRVWSAGRTRCCPATYM
jgi:hypothetical protein